MQTGHRKSLWSEQLTCRLLSHPRLLLFLLRIVVWYVIALVWWLQLSFHPYYKRFYMSAKPMNVLFSSFCLTFFSRDGFHPARESGKLAGWQTDNRSHLFCFGNACWKTPPRCWSYVWTNVRQCNKQVQQHTRLTGIHISPRQFRSSKLWSLFCNTEWWLNMWSDPTALVYNQPYISLESSNIHTCIRRELVFLWYLGQVTKVVSCDNEECQVVVLGQMALSRLLSRQIYASWRDGGTESKDFEMCF